MGHPDEVTSPSGPRSCRIRFQGCAEPRLARTTMPQERRFTFEEVAKLYDRVRPQYPEAPFEDVLSLSRIPAGDRVSRSGAVRGRPPFRWPAVGFACSASSPGPRWPAWHT